MGFLTRNEIVPLRIIRNVMLEMFYNNYILFNVTEFHYCFQLRDVDI